MEPITFPGVTCVLGPPLDWKESLYGKCANLPVCIAEGIITSCWKPSWKDRLRILMGKPIFVSIAARGGTQPPINLDVFP